MTELLKCECGGTAKQSTNGWQIWCYECGRAADGISREDTERLWNKLMAPEQPLVQPHKSVVEAVGAAYSEYLRGRLGDGGIKKMMLKHLAGFIPDTAWVERFIKEQHIGPIEATTIRERLLEYVPVLAPQPELDPNAVAEVAESRMQDQRERCAKVCERLMESVQTDSWSYAAYKDAACEIRKLPPLTSRPSIAEQMESEQHPSDPPGTKRIQAKLLLKADGCPSQLVWGNQLWQADEHYIDAEVHYVVPEPPKPSLVERLRKFPAVNAEWNAVIAEAIEELEAKR